ncbi:SAP domain-containing protein [Dialister sp.]|jgi:hypothetical protein|uniref:SAP domain-containing protein n=1 Tax=Dialister sp. TaxID=1955814 RepID=UPI003A5BD348
MGLFQKLKNIFQPPKTVIRVDPDFGEKVNTSVPEPISFKITVTMEKGGSVSIIPLEKRIAQSYPSAGGLYPHEILMLSYAHTYSNRTKHDEFQHFWYYEYSVSKPEDVLSSLLERGFLAFGDLRSSIEHTTVVDIKNILRQKKLKVSGRKAELMSRLMENVPSAELEDLFPVRYYKVTDKGQKELNDNPYVDYIHTHGRWGITVWEMNKRLHDDGADGRNFKSTLWKFFKKQSIRYYKQKDFGLYRCVRFNMCNYLCEEDQWQNGFPYLCETILYDLNGLGNNFGDMSEKFRLGLILENDFPYKENGLLTLVSGIIDALKDYMEMENWSDHELKRNLLDNFEKFTLYYRIFTNEECADIAVYEVNDDIASLEAMYRKAYDRLKKKYEELPDT